MGNHQIFSLIYIFLVWILTLVQSRKLIGMSDLYLFRRNNTSKSIIFLMIFLIFLMGFRPVDVGADTGGYLGKYRSMMAGLYIFDTSAKDWLFLRFQYICAQIMSASWFFLVVASLYIIPIYVACKRLVKNNATFLLLAAMGSFSFFSYGVNGIRNGVAASFVLLALSYISGSLKEKLLCALICFVAINCHGSVLLPIVAMLFAYAFKHPKFMFYIWSLSVLSSLIIGQSLSGIFTMLGLDDRMMHYMTLEESEETEAALAAAGFRLDFLLYSFMPILMGWYCIFRRKICDLNYHLLLGTYIYANAVWVILIRIPFSNRFAYLSWFLYAIVLAYPLFKFQLWKNQGRKVAMIIMVHVSFTFLMYFYTGL